MSSRENLLGLYTFLSVILGPVLAHDMVIFPVQYIWRDTYICIREKKQSKYPKERIQNKQKIRKAEKKKTEIKDKKKDLP